MPRTILLLAALCLGFAPAPFPRRGGQRASDPVDRALGVQLKALADPALVIGTHPQLRGGVVIDQVRPDGPAARAGLRTGDILVGLHHWEVLTVKDVLGVLNRPDRHTFTPLRFYVLRAGQVHRGHVQPQR